MSDERENITDNPRSYVAWKDEAERLMRELITKAAEIARLGKKADEEMERVKACEHIAEGDEGWERLKDLCPSTVAVAALRAENEHLKDALSTKEDRTQKLLAEVERLKSPGTTTIQEVLHPWVAVAKGAQELYAQALEKVGNPTPIDVADLLGPPLAHPAVQEQLHRSTSMDQIEVNLQDLAEKLTQAWHDSGDPTGPLAELAALATATLVYYQQDQRFAQRRRSDRMQQLPELQGGHWSNEWKRSHGT